MKFTLGGDQGLDIFAMGYPLSRQIPNPQETMDGVEQTGDRSSGVAYFATISEPTNSPSLRNEEACSTVLARL